MIKAHIMDRRSFLKAMGIIIPSALLMPNFRLLFPFQSALPRETHLFNVRPLIAYDIGADEQALRYDISDYKTQYHVTNILPHGVQKYGRKKFIEEIHNPMVSELNKVIKKGLIKASDLKPLPMPHGISLPQWYLDIMHYG